MKKMLAAGVACLMMMLMVASACAQTYEAVAQGFGGDVTVTLSIEAGTLKEVKATGEKETQGIGTRAIEMMPGMMLELNSVAVDGVSGATVTSNAILAAAQQALANSGEELIEAQAEATKMVPGTYTSTGKGFHHGLQLEVTVSEEAVTAVKVLAHDETDGVGTKAFEPVIRQIVEYQSMADVVSGATLTSNGIYAAVTDCMKQAGAGNLMISQYMSRETPVDPIPENNEVDVVVIGAGAAGTSAAAAAADAGASVILLEKTDIVGGSLRLAAGNMWAINMYEKPEFEGFGLQAFTPDEVAAYFNSEIAGGPIAKSDILYTLTNRSEETMAYLVENGWQGRGIAYSHEKNAPTMAGVFSRNGGIGFADTMQAIVEARNIDLRLGSRGVELLTDENGAVCGVTVQTDAGVYDIKAKKVILATGGFTYDDEMMETYSKGYYEGALKISGIGSTGDGHKMALKLGAVMLGEGTLNTHIADLDPYMVAVPVPFSLIVNTKGEQICANDDHYIETSMAITAQDDHTGWCIYDSGFDYFVYDKALDTYNVGGLAYLEDAVKRGEAVKAETLEELAALMGVDAQTMMATVDAHNQHMTEGTTDEFGTAPAAMLPIMTAPFYAQKRTAAVMGTIPGVSVDNEMKVLKADGQPIENLYAVGEVMFGNVLNKHYPMCGTAIGFSITGGRIAGQDAAAAIAQ